MKAAASRGPRASTLMHTRRTNETTPALSFSDVFFLCLLNVYKIFEPRKRQLSVFTLIEVSKGAPRSASLRIGQNPQKGRRPSSPKKEGTPLPPDLYPRPLGDCPFWPLVVADTETRRMEKFHKLLAMNLNQSVKTWDPVPGTDNNEEEPLTSQVTDAYHRVEAAIYPFLLPSIVAKQALRRVTIELKDMIEDPVEGIYLIGDEEGDKVNQLHALVVGPNETPYEGGFFYFFIRIPSDYPWSPPKVKLMTTGNGAVRFNPNLYNNGKVCLSILGTWAGPSWVAALNVKSVLLSIQSLMNKNPFYNEPAYENHEGNPAFLGQAKAYSDNIRYQTLKVAVLDMVEEVNQDVKFLPETLKAKVKELFRQNFDVYEKMIAESLKEQRTGCQSRFDFARLQTRINNLRATITEAIKANAGPSLCSSVRSVITEKVVILDDEDDDEEEDEDEDEDKTKEEKGKGTEDDPLTLD